MGLEEEGGGATASGCVHTHARTLVKAPIRLWTHIDERKHTLMHARTRLFECVQLGAFFFVLLLVIIFHSPSLIIVITIHMTTTITIGL